MQTKQDSQKDKHPANTIITVSTPKEVLSKQNLPYFIGISDQTAGAKQISMNMVVIPPGATAEPHYHADFESGIYLIKGRVKTLYGNDLQYSVINEAGDFIFIPPDLWHQPINLSDTEEARAIIVRNDPGEREAIIHSKPKINA
ncbi:hypothetical protein MNBD_GAMMA22-206 [hydrothermal vent metagenome]|uniref:Cupin type-2 domain-containing protein n=1 Tax=hydrothermal vent metagenome TaxID=652676 RepID=A0A3B1ADG6_9ZZZZ